MGWIKRNLIFVVGGALAVALLGAGAFYIFQSASRNSTATEKLNEIYNTLKSLQSQTPAPGNDKINNTAIAKEQHQAVLNWIASSGKYFQPVPAIPSGAVTSETFASALRRTVEQLQRQAENAGVTLPPKYDFSFSAQRPLVQFAPGSLDVLAVQLGEVKAVAEAVFSAKINALDSIQRVRVSDDDLTGPAGDYIDAHSITNELAVITPYVVTFRSFTPELSRVLGALAGSTNAFLIKSINVQPANMAGAATMPGGFPPGMMPGQSREEMGMVAPPPGAAAPPAVRGGLQTVLKEQLLRVTMEVDFVKLLPKTKS